MSPAMQSCFFIVRAPAAELVAEGLLLLVLAAEGLLLLTIEGLTLSPLPVCVCVFVV